MFVMVAGRAQGKSVTALRWLLEQPGHRMLIVANADRKHHLLRTASQMIPNSIPAEEFLKRYVSPNIVIADRIERIQYIARGREIGIDDAEEVLKIMLGGRVEFAAFNATLVPTGFTPEESRRRFMAEETMKRMAQDGFVPYSDSNFHMGPGYIKVEKIKPTAIEAQGVVEGEIVCDCTIPHNPTCPRWAEWIEKEA